MAERPILFSGAMVRAILAGAKTQTRRVVKPQPVLGHPAATRGDWYFPVRGSGAGAFLSMVDPSRSDLLAALSPYGAPGDRLWVKETFRLRADQDNKPPSQDWWKSGAWYQADDESLGPTGCGGGAGKKRPAIHMPRWASRLTLEVTGVRVERLQEISEEDAVAEGVPCWVCGGRVDGTSENDCACFHSRAAARHSFEVLWTLINGKRAPWASNPWVWVVAFKPTPGEGRG